MIFLNQNTLSNLVEKNNKELELAVKKYNHIKGYLVGYNFSEDYKNYLFLTYFPEKVKAEFSLDDEVLLYNKYYFFNLFSKKYEKTQGEDGGFGQLLFKIIEELDNNIENVNWELIGKLDDKVKNQINQ